MSRWLWLLICAVFGLVTLICGLLMPAHLRAVDASVIQQAGRRGTSLVEQGMLLARERNLGAAQMIWQAAQAEQLPGRETLGAAVGELAAQQPPWLLLGCPDAWLESMVAAPDKAAAPAMSAEAAAALGTASAPGAFTVLFLREENRKRVFDLLRASKEPAVQELLRCRTLTNTVVFAPARSSAGQPFEAALAICGLLLEEGRMTAGLSNSVYGLIALANHGGPVQLKQQNGVVLQSNTQPLEQALLDLMSLGQRLNWGQLVRFTCQIEDAETLRLLAILARKSEARLPIIYSAVTLSGQPTAVAKYLMTWNQTGMTDLAAGLRAGSGGLRELLHRNQRAYHSGLRERLAAGAPFGGFFHATLDYCWLMPSLAVSVKWFLYLCSGFLLAAALHFALPAASVLEKPLQVRGFHVAREILFALGFLLVVLLLSEPFLSQESQKVDFPFRLRLPVPGRAVPAALANVKPTIMNQVSLLTMLLFFVLQALLYTGCLVKLAEIRRQQVPARIKVKLLENEDHLFDAGLYLGFVGTIISLMLVSLNVIKFPSLMAAYSSTSFGIIFVVIFKIFHLRPTRRRFLLEAEAAGQGEAAAAPAAPAAVSPFSTRS